MKIFIKDLWNYKKGLMFDWNYSKGSYDLKIEASRSKDPVDSAALQGSSTEHPQD